MSGLELTVVSSGQVPGFLSNSVDLYRYLRCSS